MNKNNMNKKEIEFEIDMLKFEINSAYKRLDTIESMLPKEKKLSEIIEDMADSVEELKNLLK
jgi:hypothetical protein